MKKTTVVLLLVIQIALLFIFQNLYSLFKGYEEVGIINQDLLMDNFHKLKKIFSGLSIITGLLLVGTGFYLVYLFKKSKDKPDYKSIPLLQDYLLQLKNSESQLKDIVETQQEKVVQKEELNKNIINNINAAIVFLDPSGRIEIFNAVAETLFSQSYANAKNNILSKTLPGFPEIVEFIDLRKDKKISREIKSKEKIFWVHLNPINKIGMLIIIRDITEEKKREEIDRRNSNFIMLGEMTAFLAHEVKNSLGVVYGYASTLKSEKEKAEKINKEIRFLTNMMESFLSFSKPVTIDKKQEMDLVSLLKKIADEKEVSIEVTDKHVTVENDAVLIHSIFSNLILNSKEAGADRIKITFKKGKNIEIFLEDNGKGIDPKIREKIWYPFFTTKEKGTGMGLASIRKIINSLNGDIHLKSTDSSGTSFKIIFYG